MSDKKISDLVELTSLAADDVLPVVDASANATKRITGANLTTAVRGDTGTLTLGDGTAISSLGADSFRLTANATSDGTLTAWERVDEPTSAKVGTGVSQASGTFNVPNSGVWLIMLQVQFENNNDTIFAELKFNGDVNISLRNFSNSSFTTDAGFMVANLSPSIDMRVDLASVNTSEVVGVSSQNRTTITFIRLGDA